MPIPRVIGVASGIPAIAPLAMTMYAWVEPLWAPIPRQPAQIQSQAVSGMALGVLGLSLVLVAAFVVLVYRLPSVDPSKRGAWLMFLLFGSIFAVPIFWYLHIFSDPPPYVPQES